MRTKIVMRHASHLFVLALLSASILQAQAGDCVVDGPAPRLDSQPVEWTFVIASGESCIRGLRSGAMTLDSVRIVSPAKAGEAVVQGYSFAYRAPRDFKGEDSFSVIMVGANRRIRGSSTIEVRVIVR